MAEETNHKPYRLGLALSGGGAKGFAHIGVFRMMEECALRPDIIVGTSAGALMGALFADGYSAAEIQELSLFLEATLADQEHRGLANSSGGCRD